MAGPGVSPARGKNMVNLQLVVQKKKKKGAAPGGGGKRVPGLHSRKKVKRGMRHRTGRGQGKKGETCSSVEERLERGTRPLTSTHNSGNKRGEGDLKAMIRRQDAVKKKGASSVG